MPGNHTCSIQLRVFWSRLTVVVLLAALLSWVPSRARAQAVVERIEVLAVGIYELEIVGRAGRDDGPGDVWNTIAKVRLARATNSIPLQRCVSFGFEYVIVGAPAEAQIPVRMVTRFPEPGLRNPQTGQLTQTTESLILRTVGWRHSRVYTLDHDWELVPGVWTLEVWQGERKLAAQSFDLAPCMGDCRRPEEKWSCARDLSGATLSIVHLAGRRDMQLARKLPSQIYRRAARLEP